MTTDRPQAVSGRLLVLTYHDLGDGPPPLSIPVARFADHLRSLRDGGWSSLSLRGAADGLARGGWPERSVLITFDDGLRSVAEHALPALARANMTAAVFVVAGALGPDELPPRLCGPPMDAGALRETAAAGLDIGAHGMTHRALSLLTAADAEREILDSRDVLEGLLGRPVRAFAYPFGIAPPAARRLVRDRFDAGFGVTMGVVTTRSRAEHLERIDAHYLRRMASLADIDRMPARLYLAARAAGRRMRQLVLERDASG
jgi:peptidoglycan/xylan/chitin deacetylase (PgdA/CDA1 family)